jgi:broad specificity phosphatase PhoE
MKVLFVLPAESIYDQQQRVMGWRQTPAPREKLKKLKELTPRLKELGAQKVVCSDLDGQSGFFLARNLGVPCEEWKSLRRFNFANAHGQSKDKAEKLLSDMRERWKANPDIPIPGGDSLTSFKNRLAASKDKLKRNGATYVVVAAPFEIENLTGVATKFERGRIYEWGG